MLSYQVKIETKKTIAIFSHLHIIGKIDFTAYKIILIMTSLERYGWGIDREWLTNTWLYKDRLSNF